MERGDRSGPQVDEEEILPDLELDRHQPEVTLVEELRSVEPGHAPEGPVEQVGPAMIAAGERVDAAGRLEREGSASVATDVVEGPDPVLLVPEHDDRIVRHG